MNLLEVGMSSGKKLNNSTPNATVILAVLTCGRLPCKPSSRSEYTLVQLGKVRDNRINYHNDISLEHHLHINNCNVHIKHFSLVLHIRHVLMDGISFLLYFSSEKKNIKSKVIVCKGILGMFQHDSTHRLCSPNESYLSDACSKYNYQINQCIREKL